MQKLATRGDKEGLLQRMGSAREGDAKTLPQLNRMRRGGGIYLVRTQSGRVGSGRGLILE